MADRWFMSEEGDDDMGWMWDVKEMVGGKLVHVASFVDEQKCQHFLAAVKWMEGLGEFKMGLKADGITFGPTGIPHATKKRATDVVAPKVKSKQK